MGDLDPKHCRNSIKDEKKAFKLALKKRQLLYVGL